MRNHARVDAEIWDNVNYSSVNLPAGVQILYNYVGCQILVLPERKSVVLNI